MNDKATTLINIDYYDELERLATIGRATEKVFGMKACDITFIGGYTENGYIKNNIIISVEDLLDWSESEDNQCT